MREEKRDSVIILSVSHIKERIWVCVCVCTVSHVLLHNSQFEQSYDAQWAPEMFAQCTQSFYYMVNVCSSPFLFFSRHCWNCRRHIETVDQRATLSIIQFDCYKHKNQDDYCHSYGTFDLETILWSCTAHKLKLIHTEIARRIYWDSRKRMQCVIKFTKKNFFRYQLAYILCNIN